MGFNLKNSEKAQLNGLSKRYGVTLHVAEEELMQIGYYDDLYIQHYEKEETVWKYKAEPL